MTSKLETELTKAAKFKSVSGHDRQDHLAGLARASNKLTDDQFDKLSDEAANWVSAAIKALNAKDEIEEFEDAEPDQETEDDVERDSEETTEDSPKEAGDDDGTDGAEDDHESDAEAESENEAEEAAEVARAAKRKDNKGAGPASKAKTKKSTKGGKPAAEPKDEKPAKKERITTTRYDNITGERDRFGLVKGTKTWDAVQMYEKGATTAEIRDAIGGRYYNILKVLEERGHRVERFPGGKFKVTHKEDLPVKKAKK